MLTKSQSSIFVHWSIRLLIGVFSHDKWHIHKEVVCGMVWNLVPNSTPAADVHRGDRQTDETGCAVCECPTRDIQPPQHPAGGRGWGCDNYCQLKHAAEMFKGNICIQSCFSGERQLAPQGGEVSEGENHLLACTTAGVRDSLRFFKRNNPSSVHQEPAP